MRQNDLPPFKFRTKAELLEALEARLVIATKMDEEAQKQHRKDEAAYLKFFRARCREAVKLSYEQVKSGDFEVVRGRRYGSSKKWSQVPELEVPSCPSTRVPDVQRAVSLVKSWRDEPADQKPRPIVVRCTGQYQWLHYVLRIGTETKSGTVCD